MDFREDHFNMTSEASRLIEGRVPTPSDENEDAIENIATSGVADYETAVEATGNGNFHYWLLFLCGMANASDAIEILVVSFLLPSAECDLLLTSHDKGLISIMLFLGMMIGGFIWGFAGDYWGRRNTLIVCLFVNAGFGFLSAFARDLPLFLMLRFFSGLGVGGSIPLIWAYFAEFQPKDRRGAMLSGVAAFWMVGNVMVALLALAVLPMYTVNRGVLSFGWRLFAALCTLPSAFVAVCFFFMPKSPKFLLSKGKTLEALEILRIIHRKNSGNSGEPYQVTQLVEERMSEPRKRNTVSKIRNLFEKLSQLFRPPILKFTVILIAINFLTQFGYYGLWLWFPELFKRLSEYHKLHPGKSATICEMSAMDIDVNNQTIPFAHCGEPVDTWVYKESLILAAASLPTNIWTFFRMDRLGRKFFLAFGMGVSAASVFFIYLVTSSTHSLVLSCVFGAAMTMTFNSLDCLSTELFPTNLRSTGIAVTLIFARLGAIMGNEIFGDFIDLQCAVPILTVVVMLAVASILGLFLPNTTRQGLH